MDKSILDALVDHIATNIVYYEDVGTQNIEELRKMLRHDILDIITQKQTPSFSQMLMEQVMRAGP